MLEKIHVVLFGPNLPKAGVPVFAEVHDSAFHIAEFHQTVTFDALKAEVGGFDHDQLQLHWQNASGDFMLIGADKQAQKKIKALLPHDKVQNLAQWKLATGSQSLLWKSLWYGAAFVLLAIAIGIWQYDHVLSWAANRVSIETENKMGEAVLQSYNNKQDMIESGPAVDFVKQIGSRLTQGSKYQYKWLVVRDDMVNAFAMPGGIVIVNTGLLKKASHPNEVAAVIAHEVQHVEQRHSLKNMINSAGIATAAMIVMGDVNAAMIIIAHQVSTQYFSRQVEAEADLKGGQLLVKNKIKPNGMATFFKKLAAEYKGQEGIPEWLSSHPDTQNRITASEQFEKNNPCQQCQDLTWDYQAILESINTPVKTD